MVGFGPDGPNSWKRIYDPIIQSYSGLAVAQGGMQNPALVLQFYVDKISAMLGWQATLAAIVDRDRRGGGGQHVIVSMLDSAMFFHWPDVFQNFTWGKETAKESKLVADTLGGPKPKNIVSADDAAKSTLVNDWRTQRKHALFGSFRKASFPVSFSRTPSSERESAPMLGEQTNRTFCFIYFCLFT